MQNLNIRPILNDRSESFVNAQIMNHTMAHHIRTGVVPQHDAGANLELGVGRSGKPADQGLDKIRVNRIFDAKLGVCGHIGQCANERISN